MVFIEQARRLPADRGPAHPNDPGMGEGLGMFQMVHPAEQPGIDVADGQHAVHIRPIDADGNPDVGDLGRAGERKNTPISLADSRSPGRRPPLASMAATSMGALRGRTCSHKSGNRTRISRTTVGQAELITGFSACRRPKADGLRPRRFPPPGRPRTLDRTPFPAARSARHRCRRDG